MKYEDLEMLRDGLNEIIKNSDDPQETYDFIKRELKNGTLYTSQI